MTKRLTAFLLVLILSVFVCTPVFADGEAYFEDKADLLFDDSTVESALKAVSDKHKLDVVVLTVHSTDGLSDMAFADDYFDYNGYGQNDSRDGVLLLINMAKNTAWISTSGYGITAFTDAGIKYIGTQVAPYLSDANYEQAFIKFSELADDFVTKAKAGTPYDVDTLPKAPFDMKKGIIISVIAALVVAFIVTGKMKGDLKSVRRQQKAANYERPGSLRVINANQMFLYSHVDRRAKEQKSSGGSSTHRSSSGRTHGGGGFSF